MQHSLLQGHKFATDGHDIRDISRKPELILRSALKGANLEAANDRRAIMHVNAPSTES